MSKERRRSVKTAQIGMREINISIDGTAVTPVATGPDKFLVASVIDNGAGSYTINLLKPFNALNPEAPSVQVTPITAQISPAVVAVSASSVTIDCTDLAGAATDADIMIRIIGNDYKFLLK